MKRVLAGMMLLAVAVPLSKAGIFITEWMYDGTGGEFVEFTNIGSTAVDMTGWSFDDDSRTPGSVNLTVFGLLAPGESAILTEANAAAFRTAWNLGAQIKIIGNLTHNLGRRDEINLYDSQGNLVDRLTYGDDTIGGPRTQNYSGNILAENLGRNLAAAAVRSAVGDSFGSYASSGGAVGNPGYYYAAIPEPATMGILGFGLAMIVGLRRRG
ncbi:MAG TPA: lamin tail domain-containing protein [Anaerohalosphaeraceae bacterium]|nr:lamin tail domain-containing protein [Anaerohalosphaeraceae bacterium]HOL89895.1 lamin tail domain-containing protein [Anaerohalosphaeraceae bacterium]HPP57270.1 lamin tail domain-containing protein [Anaerohalosphaeraceae bacterium]